MKQFACMFGNLWDATNITGNKNTENKQNISFVILPICNTILSVFERMNY